MQEKWKWKGGYNKQYNKQYNEQYNERHGERHGKRHGEEYGSRYEAILPLCVYDFYFSLSLIFFFVGNIADNSIVVKAQKLMAREGGKT